MKIITTDKNWREGSLPRLETGESPDVFPGSPLAVIGLWVFALRQRFADVPDCGLPWVYSDEMRPFDDEDGELRPDGVPRKLLIESAYNVLKAVRNYRPAIYVGRGGGPLTLNKQATNNFVGQETPTGFKGYHCFASMNISIECESETAGESSTIAETVWAFVLSTREIFRKDFGLHEITEPVMTDTSPGTKDKEVWTTVVQFSVTFDMRWTVQPIAPKLREIITEFSGKSNPEEFLRSMAQRDGLED